MTNREFYLRILALGERLGESGLSLRAYLTNLWAMSDPHRHRAALTAEELATLLESAAETTAEPDPEWRTTDYSRFLNAGGFAEFEATLLSQICDLWDFEDDPPGDQAYFGVSMTRPPGSGERTTPTDWYNFDPVTYLECAAVGTFGGWRESDDSGRVALPADAVSPLVPPDPEIIELDPLTWEDAERFLCSGQLYE